MKQSITAPSYAVNNVSNLPDIVKNQATTVKTTFDKASADIKVYETNLIAELNGDSGSKKIGHQSTNITSNNVGDALEEIVTALNDVTLGDIPNNSITDLKLNSDVKVGSLASLTTTEKASVVGAINEVVSSVSDVASDVSTINGEISTLETDLNIIRTAKLATGSVNTMLIDTDGIFDLTRNGNILTIIPNLTTTNATVTVAVDGQTAKLVKKANDIGNFVALDIGDLKKNTPIQLVWDSVSDFFIYAPKGGTSNIKSIQRGTTTINSANVNVTVSSIDLTKSVAKTTQKPNVASTSESSDYVKAQLTTQTNLNLVVGIYSSAQQPVVEWEVIEFNNVKSIQSGTLAISSATTNVTITGINTAKSLIFFSYNAASSVGDSKAPQLAGRINSATQLEFTQTSTQAKSVYWYVIEFI